MTIKEAAAAWGSPNGGSMRFAKPDAFPARIRRAGSGLFRTARKSRWISAVTGVRWSPQYHLRAKPLPIGVSDYRDTCKSYYYVDKTLMIKEFLDERPKVSLFTRPRRFGKTLNMDMLRTFFEKTTEDTSVYFRDKKIWSCGESYLAHHRKYPVIFLSFKDVKYTSWEETYQTLQKLIAQEFRRHDELASSSALSDYEKRNIPFLQQKPLTKWNIKCPCGH